MRVPGLVLAAVLLATSLSVPADFGAEPPIPIPGLAGWEVLAGELTSPRLRAAYRFYVDPARTALFTVMRYRLRPEGGQDAPSEKLVWNERPGQGAPLRCFEWIEAGGAGSWRELSAGSSAYLREMQTLRLVLAEQNRDYHRQLEGEAARR